MNKGNWTKRKIIVKEKKNGKTEKDERMKEK